MVDRQQKQVIGRLGGAARRAAPVVLVAVLGACSLFSESSPSTTTTEPKAKPTSTSTTAPITTSTQPPGTAGPEVLKPVLNQLMEDVARLTDELLLNKGQAVLNPDSPERAEFRDYYSPGNPWPDEQLSIMAGEFDGDVFLEPFPGEERTTWAWVPDVFPRPNGGSPDEVEFVSCEEGRGLVVDGSGNKIDESIGQVATRLKARRYEGIWKIHSRVEELDPNVVCVGGRPS